MIVRCTAYAGNLSRGLMCDREMKHPGMHRDNGVNAYWTHGAPALETIELPTHQPTDLDPALSPEASEPCPGCDCDPVGYAPHNGKGPLCHQPTDSSSEPA